MNRTDILSVNPSQATLGEKNHDLAINLAKSARKITASPKNMMRDTVDFLTAVRNPSRLRLSSALISARLIAGTILILAGAFDIDPALFSIHLAQGLKGILLHWEAIALIIVGGCLCLGFCTRLVSAAGAATFAFLSALEIKNGFFPAATLMMSALSAIFSILGAGSFSMDNLTRLIIAKAVRRHRTYKSEKRNREAGRRLTYKAFRYTSHR